MSMCHPLVIPTWYSLLGFTWNFIPGEARCWVFLRNWVTYRAHLPLDVFGGWHFSISPVIDVGEHFDERTVMLVTVLTLSCKRREFWCQKDQHLKLVTNIFCLKNLWPSSILTNPSKNGHLLNSNQSFIFSFSFSWFVESISPISCLCWSIALSCRCRRLLTISWHDLIF